MICEMISYYHVQFVPFHQNYTIIINDHIIIIYNVIIAQSIEIIVFYRRVVINYNNNCTADQKIKLITDSAARAGRRSNNFLFI